MSSPPSKPPAIPYRIATEPDLVLRSLDGESAAFDELVRRFRAGVLLIAERILPCRSLAEDVAQDVLVRAHRALPLLNDPAKFGPWLHAIARHSALRAAQGERRTESQEAVDIERRIAAQSHAPGPASQVVDREDQASIRRLVLDLPPDFGEPIILHYWEQWPLERIAGFLAVPVSTIKWRMYQGRKRLMPRLVELLEENGDER